MKKIVILGSTGSIGTQALDVLRRFPKKDYSVIGLSAHSNIALIKAQIAEFKPKIVSVWKEKDADGLIRWCREKRYKLRVIWGLNGLIETARHKSANFVLSAVVGSIGIKPLLEAINSKKVIALANKEALVVAGKQIMEAAKRKKVSIIPVDSEHSAIFQCLKNEQNRFIKKIILTASGGPFYKKSSERGVTVSKALSHPTWKMGRKITIDSATLMNKGLEAIEASRLFNVPLENIEIVIHPQSIVHSMVQFIDGSVIAQLSNPDMRLPIQYALTYPKRVPSRIKELALEKVGKMDFAAPDFKKFPCLRLALEAARTGGTMPAVMNAANEIAVESFLKKEIRFSDIPVLVEKVMKKHKSVKNAAIEKILEEDAKARETAKVLIKTTKGRKK